MNPHICVTQLQWLLTSYRTPCTSIYSPFFPTVITYLELLMLYVSITHTSLQILLWRSDEHRTECVAHPLSCLWHVLPWASSSPSLILDAEAQGEQHIQRDPTWSHLGMGPFLLPLLFYQRWASLWLYSLVLCVTTKVYKLREVK